MGIGKDRRGGMSHRTPTFRRTNHTLPLSPPAVQGDVNPTPQLSTTTKNNRNTNRSSWLITY